MVVVRSPGAPADTILRFDQPAWNAPGQHRGPFGRVDSEYSIGKYEVTIQQYADFLNAVAKSDPYGLYDPQMGTDLTVAGIARAGASGNFTYFVTGPGGVDYGQSSGNRPIGFIVWFQAARFANWLCNNRPIGPQTNATTEDGAYSLLGTTTVRVSRNITNPNSGQPVNYWIPTTNEWYKAAYFDPAANGGAGGYWLYPTRTNTLPGNTLGPLPNQMNAKFPGGVMSLTQAAQVAGQNYATDVGAYSGSPGPWGTFDQGGNVFELTEENFLWGSSMGDETQYSATQWGFPAGNRSTFGLRVAGAP
jgi:formylglycine-generating enzyme